MILHNLKLELQQMENQWHKILFLCNDTGLERQLKKLEQRIEVLNLNRMLSELLINIPKKKYPLYVEEILQNFLNDQSKLYLLQHIEILFDPVLQINPVRLLENISKRNRLIIKWPGKYTNGILIYAESGHPEYFTCSDFEGKVIVN